MSKNDIQEQHRLLVDMSNRFRLCCAEYIKDFVKANGVRNNTWNGTKWVYKVEGFDLPYPLMPYNVLSISADHNIYPHIETDSENRRTFYEFEHYELMAIINELAKIG